MPFQHAEIRLGKRIKTTIAGETTEAFVPPLLPPDPPVRMGDAH